MNKLLLFIIILFLQTHLLAQNTNKHEGAVLMFNVHYAFQQPSGDLSQRFGRSNQIGLDIDYLTKKNFILGGSAAYQFGTEVREDVISTLRDNNGTIVGNDQGIASVVLRQRGLRFDGIFGKIIPLQKGQRSGIRISIGAGFYQHWVRVQDDTETVNQLKGDYKKGYDRLSNGFSTSQFVGYQILSESRRINAYIGIEALQGYTQNRRTFNYDTMLSDTARRNDRLISLKIGWTIIPVFMDDEIEEIFY